MPNIAFNITGREDLQTESDKLITELKKRGAKTNTDAYEQMIQITLGCLDAKDIRDAGGDIDGLDAALDSIRRKFRTLADSKQEITDARDAAIADARQKADARAEAAENEKERYKGMAEAASAEAAKALLQTEQAQTAMEAAKKQAESAQALIAAKDDKIDSLREQLESANDKLAGYDALQRERDSLEKQLMETKNKALTDGMTAQLKSQQEMEEYKSRIAALEAEVKLLREFQGISESQ